MNYNKFRKKFPQGCKVTCKINDVQINDAKINYEGRVVYICQDSQEGAGAENMLGYKYSWGIVDIGTRNLEYFDVINLKLAKTITTWTKEFRIDNIKITKNEIIVDGKEYTPKEFRKHLSNCYRTIRKYNKEFKK